MKSNKQIKPIEVVTDSISAACKATAIKAADNMPAEKSIREQSKYVYDQLTAAHPETAWGVELDKCTTGKLLDNKSMWNSLNASAYLSLWVGDDLWLRVFALKSKADGSAFAELVRSSKIEKD